MTIEGSYVSPSEPRPPPAVHEGENVPLLALWILGIAIAIIILLGIVGFTIYSFNEANNGTINGTPYCSSLTAGLPDISNQLCCQDQGNVKYNLDIKVDMSPAVISYQSVCKQFCAGTYDLETDVCSNDTPSDIALVNACLAQMKPRNCIGQAMPLAISNGTIYYGLRADINGCTGVTCTV